MDLLLPIFQLVYFVVHFLYSLGQAVLDCFHELYHIISNNISWKRHFVPDSRQLLQDALTLKKLPRHLGFIFVPKQTNNFKHICYLINWSLGLGIHNISLYDVEGIFKLKLPTLLDNITQICTDATVKVIVDGQMYRKECNFSKSIHNNSTIHKYGLKTINSGTIKYVGNDCIALNREKTRKHNDIDFVSSNSKNILTLNVLCIEDGKEDIVKMAKKAFQNKNLALDSNYINNNLITKGQIDPDLMVIIGRPICSLGFLPWQIRLTEFLDIPSISRLDYFEFRKLVQIYSKCEQRFGS